MKYEPKTDEEIERGQLIAAGTKCTCIVQETAEHLSVAKGTESIKLTLAIYEDVSMRAKLRVYLTPNFPKLFKHAIKAFGLNYDKGEISHSDFMGRSCACEIGIQDAKNGYKAQNVVVDFLVSPDAEALSNRNNHALQSEKSGGVEVVIAPDDLPF